LPLYKGGNIVKQICPARRRELDQDKPLRVRHSVRGIADIKAGIVCFLLSSSFLGSCLCDPVSPLSTEPDWSQIQKFQKTITHDEFVRLLENVYAPNQVAAKWIKIEPDRAEIRTEGDQWLALKFAANEQSRKSVPKYWKTPARLPRDNDLPLKGLTIALDPGHLGGKWAKMEERWFQIGDSKPVTEGDLTLQTAKVLAARLRAIGARVVFVRAKEGPITSLRPSDLRAEALASLKQEKVEPIIASYDGPADPMKEHAIQWEAERLFYRVAEIHERARKVNRELQPDLTVCLHFDAEPWGDPAHPTLTDANHLHLIVNGAYSESELDYDDVRFNMLLKLLSQAFDEELGLGESLAKSLSEATGLPAFRYQGTNAYPVGTTGYVWVRNLLANRLYRCPVAYVECYVMNSRSFFQRFQAGPYPGEREFDGVMRKNVYDEYADGVARGLEDYFRAARGEGR
jgi:N-acetylmuramoyl-L-alanine amidase